MEVKKKKSYARRKYGIAKPGEHLSETQVHEILKDIWGNGMQIKEASEFYCISRTAIYRYMKENEELKATYTRFTPTDIINRAKLPETERYDLLCRDAAQNLEMTLAVMNKRLQDNLANPKANAVETKELISFVKELAPYVLEKKSTVGNPTFKAGQKETPKSKAFQVFKTQIKKAQ